MLASCDVVDYDYDEFPEPELASDNEKLLEAWSFLQKELDPHDLELALLLLEQPIMPRTITDEQLAQATPEEIADAVTRMVDEGVEMVADYDYDGTVSNATAVPKMSFDDALTVVRWMPVLTGRPYTRPSQSGRPGKRTPRGRRDRSSRSARFKPREAGGDDPPPEPTAKFGNRTDQTFDRELTPACPRCGERSVQVGLLFYCSGCWARTVADLANRRAA